MRPLIRLCFLAVVATNTQPVTAAITVDTVPVGDAGNANDPATGNLYGGVPYDYRIGKFEVTVGQYTAFLNAVAATDTYALYNMSMGTVDYIAGIAQSGVSGSYTYSVIGSANHPVTYVSWGDAARFSNWLNNGQPTGAQGPGTTETGAYTLNGATTNADLNAVSRNSGATWFIPSESEWYKAAYHDPRTTVQGGPPADSHYWLYPTKTNNTPYSDQPPGSGAPTQSNTANFYADDSIANGYNDGLAVTGSPNITTDHNYLTDAGAYTLSASPYGTYDQGGNVFEWNEALISGSFRVARGGDWSNDSSYLQSSSQGYGSPDSEANHFGFRVAAAPEPIIFDTTTHLMALHILNGSTARLTQNGAAAFPPYVGSNKYLSTKSLSISGTGKLDLTNNTVIVDYTDSSSPLSVITAMIISGAHVVGGVAQWDGAGINSGTAHGDNAANPSNALTAVGVLDLGDPSVNPGYDHVNNGEFNIGGPGEPLAAHSILIKYTYLGDTQLAGKVQFSDFLVWKAAFAANLAGGNVGGWAHAQFDYSEAQTTFADFLIWKHAFELTLAGQLPPLHAQPLGGASSFTSVPEPSSHYLGLVALLMVGLRGLPLPKWQLRDRH